MCFRSSSAYAGYPMYVFSSMIKLLTLSSKGWSFPSYISCLPLPPLLRPSLSCPFWIVLFPVNYKSYSGIGLKETVHFHACWTRGDVQTKQSEHGRMGYFCSPAYSGGWGRRIIKSKRGKNIKEELIEIYMVRSLFLCFLFFSFLNKGCQGREGKKRKPKSKQTSKKADDSAKKSLALH